MSAEEFIQPNYLVHTDASDYKKKLENAIAILNQMAGNFAPHASTVNDDKVNVKPGRLPTFDGEKPAQTSAAIVFPTVNPRIDRMAIDKATGDLVIIVGTEAASPVPPAYSANHWHVAQVSLAVGQLTIGPSDFIEDERGGNGGDVIAIKPPLTTLTGSDYTAPLGLTAYSQEFIYKVLIDADNPGACTMDFDPGVKSVKLPDGSNLSAGELKGGMLAQLLYDGTNLVLLNPEKIKPSFSVHRNGTDQSNITSVDKVEWTAKDFDTNNDFDLITNFRHAPTIPGKYLYSATVYWFGIVSADALDLYLFKNGITYKHKFKMTSFTFESQTITAIVEMNGTTDYVDVYTRNNQRDISGLSGAASKTYFTGCKLD